MSATWLGAAVAVGAGSILSPVLTRFGLHQLRFSNDRSSRLVGAGAGAFAAGVAISAWHRTDEWQFLPALLVWGCALVAAAIGDSLTRRVATGLVRAATLAVVVLLIVGSALGGGWSVLLLSVVASVAASVTLLACWRFLGVGFGDVRLAALGGLGLGNATARGLVIGLLVLIVVLGCQVAFRSAGECKQKAPVPLGPALATSLLAALAF